MTHKKISTLFAVVLTATPMAAHASPRTLATGRPACGNVMSKGGSRRRCVTQTATIDSVIGTAAPVSPAAPDPWAAPEVDTPITATTGAAAMLIHALDTIGITVPRQLRTGAPACGNVATKGPPTDCTTADAGTSRR